MAAAVAGIIWLIVKNVVGFALMLIAGPVGILLPGPGGIPLFLIGFALVTFPGKRRLTARFMRLKMVSPLRRKVRPWLKRHGMILLPPRKFRRMKYDDETILHLGRGHHRSARSAPAVA